jgi:hypothetical protein
VLVRRLLPPDAGSGVEQAHESGRARVAEVRVRAEQALDGSQ